VIKSPEIVAPQVFRIRRGILVQGGLFTAIYAAATAAIAWLALLDVPRSLLVACMGIAVFGSMTLLSVYMLLAYSRETVKISETSIQIRSVFHQRSFDALQIERLTLKGVHGNASLVFDAVGRRTRLNLYGYGPEDCLQLTRLFRNIVPGEHQVGWPLFCHRVAIPLRNHFEAQAAAGLKPAEGHLSVRRSRYDRLFAAAVAISAVAGSLLWWFTGLVNLVPLPLLLIVFWRVLRYSVPMHGPAQSQVTARPDGRALVLAVLMILVSQLLLAGFVLAGMRELGCWLALAVLLPTSPVVVYRLHSCDRELAGELVREAESAPATWEAGERTSPPHAPVA
jgi:hypothetical protein